MTAQDRASEHDELSQRVEDLRAFEREYRLRLAMHLEDCLSTVQTPVSAHPLHAAVRRLGDASDADLQEVLAELPERQRQRLLTTLLRVPAVTS